MPSWVSSTPSPRDTLRDSVCHDLYKPRLDPTKVTVGTWVKRELRDPPSVMMKSTVAIVAIVASMSGASAFTGAALSARNALGAPRSICRVTRPGLEQRAGVQVSAAGTQRRSGVLQLRSQGQGSDSKPADLPAKALLWTTWVVYMQQIFFSDQPCGAQATGDLCGIGMPTIM